MSGPTAPQSPAPVPSDALTEAPPPPPDFDDPMSDPMELPEWLSFLRNRVILGGMGIVVMMLLLAIVLVAFGSEDSGVAPPVALGNGTPEETPREFAGEGLAGHMLFTVSLRNGPSTRFPVLGVVAAGALVSVIGRDADASWLQVVPSAGITGWVPSATVDVTGDVMTLAIGEAGQGPSIDVPTQIPVIVPEPTVAPPPTAPPTLAPTPLPVTATPSPLPPPTATSVPPPPTAPLQSEDE